MDRDLKHIALIVQEIQRICMKECCEACKKWTATFVGLLEEGDLDKINNYASNYLSQPDCQKTTPGESQEQS